MAEHGGDREFCKRTSDGGGLFCKRLAGQLASGSQSLLNVSGGCFCSMCSGASDCKDAPHASA